MRKSLVSFIIIISIILSTLSFTIVADDTQRKVVRIAISNDENIVIDRIMYTALDRMGYDVVVSSLGMKTAVISVDNGENDLLAVQALGIEDIYTNLVPVEVPISYVDMVVYCKEGVNQEFDSWDDLNGLKVIYHSKNVHVENHIPSGAEKIAINDYDRLFQTLLDDGADVLVLPITELSDKIVPKGIVKCGIVQTIDTYLFANKENSELAKQLEEELSRMLKDGTVENIKKGVTSNSSKEKVILHISSYSPEMLWENKIVQGVQDALADNKKITYYNLSLNLGRLSNVEAQYEIMEKSIHSTFIEGPPDVIIASDNDAFDFVVQYYNILFNNIPVIYCGINNFSPDMIYGLEENITGIEEVYSTGDTAYEMLKLFPKTDNIYILNDYSTSGLMSRKFMEDDISHLKTRVNLVYNANASLYDIMEEISDLEGNTLVLCGSYYVDGTGKYFSEQELSEIFAKGLNTPVFCQKSSNIGFGEFIGGKVVDGYNQGYEAGKLVLDILGGKKISELDINDDFEKKNSWVFDYSTFNEHGLKINQLPLGYTLVNKELSLFESNPMEAILLISLLVLALLVAVLFIYFSYILRKKNNSLLETQKDLHTAEELIEKDNEIRRSQADLYTLLNSVMQPVLVCDLNDGSLLYVNDAYVNVFAFESREDALEHSIEDISEEYQISGEKSSVLIERNHLNIKNHNYIKPFEWKFISRFDQNIYGRVMVNGIRFNERSAYVAIIQDITIDKMKNEILQKAAEAERKANKMKSQFVVNMSHELRTPMNAIIGLSQIAMKKNFEKDAHEMFGKMNKSAKLLLELINDVLDFSKIEADKIELFIDKVELESVLNDAIMVAVPRIENKPIEVYLNIDENLPQYVLGDKTRIWQVLKNILDNSAKYTEKGSITLSVLLKKKQSEYEKAMIEFCISDTGLGMSKEQLESLYKPFEQFHQSKSTASGTGLGMTITKQLIELMKGEIKVSSTIGEGTVTKITIPFKVPEESISIKEYIKGFDLAGTNIFLAGFDSSTSNVFEVLATNMNASLIKIKEINDLSNSIEMLQNQELTLFITDTAWAKDIETKSISCKKLLLVPSYRSMLTQSDVNEMGFDISIEKPLLLADTAKKLFSVLKGYEEDSVENAQAVYPNVSVLLVEDNEINQEVAACMLEFFDIHPDIASNGKEAIEYLEKKQYDLVFMDLFMPVMDGHEATKYIRGSDCSYNNVTIVAMTANVVKEEIERCMRNGMNDHIGKPLEFKVLDNILKKWLR